MRTFILTLALVLTPVMGLCQESEQNYQQEFEDMLMETIDNINEEIRKEAEADPEMAELLSDEAVEPQRE